MSDMQKNVTPGRRKGCPNYSPEFKQQLVAASCEPGIPKIISAMRDAVPLIKSKRTARTVLTGTGYSVGRVIRQGNSSLT